ncbi:potassium/proton antiporter, partial [Mesorhizobium sp. M0767]
TGLGLSFEPTAPVARGPVFLSAGEIRDRIAAIIRNRRKPAEAQAVEAAAEMEPVPQPVVEKTTGDG